MWSVQLISIRLANKKDNEELLALEKMCPQGTSLVLQLDRSPDFFRRSRVYENYEIYVAETEGRISGTVASANKQFNFAGKRVKGIYIYDLRVHPEYRGRGIGSKLVQEILNHNDKAQIAYGIIREENNPSLNLFRKLGFQNIHNIALYNIPLYKRHETIGSKVRTMTAEDAPSVAALMNDHYQDHDFFLPVDAATLLHEIERLPGYGMEKVQVAEDGGKIIACAGLWDYSEIFQISALRVSAGLRILSFLLKFINIFKETVRLPSVGESFKLTYVRDFAFADRTELLEGLIQRCLHLAHRYGCSFLSFPLSPDDPIVALLTRYRPTKVTFQIHAKSLTDEALTPSKKIYIDTADL